MNQWREEQTFHGRRFVIVETADDSVYIPVDRWGDPQTPMTREEFKAWYRQRSNLDRKYSTYKPASIADYWLNPPTIPCPKQQRWTPTTEQQAEK